MDNFHDLAKDFVDLQSNFSEKHQATHHLFYQHSQMTYQDRENLNFDNNKTCDNHEQSQH